MGTAWKGYTVLMDVASGLDARTGRCTDGVLGVGALEAGASGGQGVDVGCLDLLVAVAAEGIPALLVGGNEQNVRSLRHEMPPHRVLEANEPLCRNRLYTLMPLG